MQTIILPVFVFAILVFLDWRKSRLDVVRKLVSDGIKTALATVLLFIALFIAHLLVLSSMNLVKECRSVSTAKDKDLNELRQTLTAQQGAIRLDISDPEAREKLKITEQELKKAEARIKQLEAKRWLLSKEEIVQLAECLRNASAKGKVFFSPAMFDSAAVEYAEQLQLVFKDAGFEVRSVDITKPEEDSVIAYSFTGARICFADSTKPPPHALAIPKCFRTIGREMQGQIDTDVDPATVLSAIGGGRP